MKEPCFLYLKVVPHYYDGREITAAYHHNERIKVNGLHPNLNPEKSCENYHIVGCKGPYRDVVKGYVSDCGYEISTVGRRNKVFAELLIGAGKTFWANKDEKEIHEFFERTADFFRQRIDEKYIISAVVHMDEPSPHMHLAFCPVKNGKIGIKLYFDKYGEYGGYGKWIADYYEYMYGFYPYLSQYLTREVTGKKSKRLFMNEYAVELDKAIYTNLRIATEITGKNYMEKKDELMAYNKRMMRPSETYISALHQNDMYIAGVENENASLREENAGLREECEKAGKLLSEQEKLTESLRQKLGAVASRDRYIPSEMIEYAEKKLDMELNPGKYTDEKEVVNRPCLVIPEKENAGER